MLSAEHDSRKGLCGTSLDFSFLGLLPKVSIACTLEDLLAKLLQLVLATSRSRRDAVESVHNVLLHSSSLVFEVCSKFLVRDIEALSSEKQVVVLHWVRFEEQSEVVRSQSEAVIYEFPPSSNTVTKLLFQVGLIARLVEGNGDLNHCSRMVPLRCPVSTTFGW
ncbi:unnamed protein product [Strongylus vulgaris]|uniref:Uncharacterized protein n=1 Tax=Strongylus vulgaris TaxID=40348 RepID=A0A3P7I8T2_STRVU|nr:unnamed protein product [Strongylus vulgaris]